MKLHVQRSKFAFLLVTVAGCFSTRLQVSHRRSLALPAGNRWSVRGCPQVSTETVETERLYRRQRNHLDIGVAELASSPELKNITQHNAFRIWELWPPLQSCSMKEKVGRYPEDGGKWVCGVSTLLQHRGCTVFSFGSNGELSFEEGLIAETPCSVHVFDPTLSEEQLHRLAEIKAKAPQLSQHNYGLAAYDGQMTLNKDAGTVVAQVKTLKTLMGEIGVDWIDLLKVDIEGAEWAFLEHLLDNTQGRLPFTQLQIEFHLMPMWGAGWGSAEQALRVLSRLEKAGARVFSQEQNFGARDHMAAYAGCIEFSFLNADAFAHA